MAKPSQIPAVPEVKDVFALIELVTNPQKVKQHLQALEAYRNDINARIELVGKAEDIERLHGEAQELKRDAGIALERANDKAKEVLEEARAKAEKLEKDAAEGLAKREAALDARSSELSQQGAEVAEKRAAAEKLAADSNDALKQAARDMAQATEMRDRYEAAIRRLKAAGVKVDG